MGLSKGKESKKVCNSMKYKSYYLPSGWHLVCKKRYPIGVRLMLFDGPGIRVNCGTVDFLRVNCEAVDREVLFI